VLLSTYSRPTCGVGLVFVVWNLLLSLCFLTQLCVNLFNISVQIDLLFIMACYVVRVKDHRELIFFSHTSLLYLALMPHLYTCGPHSVELICIEKYTTHLSTRCSHRRQLSPPIPPPGELYETYASSNLAHSLHYVKT